MGGRWSLKVTASTTDLLFALTVRVVIMYVFFTYGHVCEALVDERRLCIRSLSCLRSNLLCCACSLRMTLLGPGRLVLRR